MMFFLEILPHGKFKLLNEDLLEGIEVILFVEDKRLFLNYRLILSLKIVETLII